MISLVVDIDEKTSKILMGDSRGKPGKFINKKLPNPLENWWKKSV